MFDGKPKIKTRTVTILKKVAPPAPHTPSRPSSAARPSATRYQLSSAAQRPRPARESPAVSNIRKRKVSPSTPPLWASSDSESDADSDRLAVAGASKRLKSSSIEPASSNRQLEPDPNRRIRIRWDAERTNGQKNGTDGQKNGTDGHTGTGGDRLRRGSLTHGLLMTRGEFAKNYRPAWPGPNKHPILELQYPSPLPPESFEAKVPTDSSEYNPLGDIQFSIEEIIAHYLPADLSAELSSDVTGPVRILKRAAASGSFTDYALELSRFNALVRAKVADGSIARTLDALPALPLSLVKHMTQQTYSRIVSPQSHKLRRVKGKETTYGELLPIFIHRVFAQTRLASHHTFVDLGSGVGNVVLQSALQTGAASYGIEIMPLAAALASQQAAELRARARLWHIATGPMTLLHGSFLESPAIDKVLARADVVLVNNKVFGEALNNALLQKFLDLKIGARVVSLESFGAGGRGGVRGEQSIAGLFEEERFESGTDCVSWAGESVEYFIATKVR
ncbi:S-adenosyl-L-methionine-dependent methyltransferase [Boeremia exigua]|uniref:S-adenosyl-L-methionine-dependent methyltransferase n=1 Tax=Boeremia exigua TaxID=749465 RepID=UPI001E8D4540|nr:S-adenosyl-L-methionine-dependent methyltransferase [Boeremia exigua]KAH6642066.1 S-adenosyl-L-methionine-dependent methyltransferase [Boeremia exigua]